MDDEKEKQYVDAIEALNRKVEFQAAQISTLQTTIKDLLSKPKKGE